MPVAHDHENRLPAFHRLDGVIGWPISENADSVWIDPATGALELGFRGTRLSPLTDASGSFGGLTLPTGVTIAADGTVLVANASSGEILHTPHAALHKPGHSTAPGFIPLWNARTSNATTTPDACILPTASVPPGPYELVEPRGLAFSRDGDLLVTDSGGNAGGRLLIYTWPGMRVRRILQLGGALWDIAVNQRGEIFVADAEANSIRRFSRSWQEIHWPGGSALPPADSIQTNPASPNSSATVLNQPKHIVIDDEQVLYVVDTQAADGLQRLSRLDQRGIAYALNEREIMAFWHGRYPAPIQHRDDALFLPGSPCTEHGRVLQNVVLDRQGRLPQGPVLRYQPPPGRRVRSGTWVTDAIDSGEFNFAWHRLRFEVALPEDSALEVQSYTAATALDPTRIAGLPENAWSNRVVITPETPLDCALSSAPGRFMWLRIRFVGNGISSPSIHGLDILGPRQSSLRFLPAPFHEDPQSRDFLDRFLSYFDTIFDEIRHDVTTFSARLTPTGVPDGAQLAWLASWFDIRFLAVWDESTRREFLRNAMNLHRTRGTIAGLKALLRLHLGVSAPMPVIIESFRLRQFAQRLSVADAESLDRSLMIGGVPVTSSETEGDEAHRFIVVVPEAKVVNAEAVVILQQLVDAFKPAHTAWRLIRVGPGVRIGCQSSVGIDTLIGSYTSAPLGQAQLGQTAQLSGPTNRLPQLGSARLGISQGL